jgi:phosphoenolpyruvate carboxykinase (GTP)
VLAWIAERCEGSAGAVETAIGLVPAPGALPVDGLALADEDLEALLAVDVTGWEAELPLLAEHFATFGDRLPPALHAQLEDLRARLGDA